ncbi:hypothetical protein Vafri_10439 [Volvox africanus]|uniref:Peptidase M11 gametolysin domain-containing protein n=1 Tax=Volvox africanus TaxID=51714 RepID=A0A8J4EZL3_9CHLO|nr:hypothetical protein Vafri_10439 [Volvox africanus]
MRIHRCEPQKRSSKVNSNLKMSSERPRRPWLPQILLVLFMSIIWHSPETLLVAAQTSPSPRSFPTPAITSTVTLQGKLVYHTTRPNGTWALQATDGKTYLLPAAQPVNPASGAPVAPNRWLNLICYQVAARVCSRITVRDVFSSFPMRVQSANVVVRALVLVVSLSNSTQCNGQDGANVTDVRNAFLGPNGYADYFNNCSYGSMQFEQEALTVVPTILPCSDEIMASPCDVDFIADLALQQLPSEINPSLYSHFVYVLPKYFAPTCRWVGLAELSGTQTWFSPDGEGIFRKGMVMQQILHNFGLYDSWKDGVPYEDYSTAMGSGDSCPSAPELWRLGWATSLAQLTSLNLQINMFKSFTLPATYLGPSGILIKILPDWLGMSYIKNLYLALRTKMAGDTDLLEAFNGKLNVHEADKDIDNSLTAVGDPRVTFKAAIDPLKPFTLSSYRLQIFSGSLVNNRTAINISICRYLRNPNDCQGLQPPPPPQQLQSPPQSRSPPQSPPPSRSPPSAPKTIVPPPSPPASITPPPPTPTPATPLSPSPLPPSPLSPSPPPNPNPFTPLSPPPLPPSPLPPSPPPTPNPKPPPPQSRAPPNRLPASPRAPRLPTRPKPPTPPPQPPKPLSPPPPPRPPPPSPRPRPPATPRTPRTPAPPRPLPTSPFSQNQSSWAAPTSSVSTNPGFGWPPSPKPHTLAGKRSTRTSPPSRPPKKSGSGRRKSRSSPSK